MAAEPEDVDEELAMDFSSLGLDDRPLPGWEAWKDAPNQGFVRIIVPRNVAAQVHQVPQTMTKKQLIELGNFYTIALREVEHRKHTWTVKPKNLKPHAPTTVVASYWKWFQKVHPTVYGIKDDDAEGLAYANLMDAELFDTYVRIKDENNYYFDNVLAMILRNPDMLAASLKRSHFMRLVLGGLRGPEKVRYDAYLKLRMEERNKLREKEPKLKSLPLPPTEGSELDSVLFDYMRSYQQIYVSFSKSLVVNDAFYEALAENPADPKVPEGAIPDFFPLISSFEGLRGYHSLASYMDSSNLGSDETLFSEEAEKLYQTYFRRHKTLIEVAYDLYFPDIVDRKRIVRAFSRAKPFEVPEMNPVYANQTKKLLKDELKMLSQ
jgi:hypothetical protein